MCQSRAGCRLNLFLRHVRLAVSNVVPHGIVEQHGLLSDDAHLLAQRGQRDVADVLTVNEQSPVADVEEARDQMDEGALARARSDDSTFHAARQG